MICPYCGEVEESIPVPDSTKGLEVLGKCPNCDEKIWARPTTKDDEESQLKTVEEGEKREAILARIYLEHEQGHHSEPIPGTPDIDRKVYDADGNLIYFLEIKERSCTINAYADTKFPYAKIRTGKELIKEHNLPVFIVLKFKDCWARLRVKPEKDYRKGDEPFAPVYRPWQRDKKRQIPVLIDVETLEVLPWHELCWRPDRGPKVS